MKVQWCVSLINVLPPGRRPSPVIVSFLSASIGSTKQMRHSSLGHTYIFLVCNALSLSDGLAGYTFPLHNTLAVQKLPAGSIEPVRAPPIRPYYAPRTLRPSQLGPA